MRRDIVAHWMSTVKPITVVAIAQMVLRGSGSDGDTDTASVPEIRAAIHVVTETELTAEEIDRVATRLAAAGWPLAAPAR